MASIDILSMQVRSQDILRQSFGDLLQSPPTQAIKATEKLGQFCIGRPVPRNFFGQATTVADNEMVTERDDCGVKLWRRRCTRPAQSGARFGMRRTVELVGSKRNIRPPRRPWQPPRPRSRRD
jgi:hypothetical protein